MQGYISESLAGLPFAESYGLTEYKSQEDLLVMFGMYREEDFQTFEKHKGQVILVWQGMDAKQIEHKWINTLRKKGKHFSISHWIKSSLDTERIPNEFRPLSATKAAPNPQRKGRSVYFYTSDLSEDSARYYGEHMIDEIQRKTGMQIIKGKFGLYPHRDMPLIYRECFINLRLTEYDGCPNTNLEMGLMGRKSVFNGDIPGSLKWRTIDDICAHIVHEYEHRFEENDLPEQICEYLNVSLI